MIRALDLQQYLPYIIKQKLTFDNINIHHIKVCVLETI